MSTTATPKKHIDELHFEHNVWIKSMQFYYDELRTFESRLEELVTRNTKTEVTSQIEHFQNQFIRNKEVSEEIISKCKDHDKFLANQAKDHPIAIDHVLFADHTKLRDEVETFEKIYIDLKKEFMTFLRKWM